MNKLWYIFLQFSKYKYGNKTHVKAVKLVFEVEYR